LTLDFRASQLRGAKFISSGSTGTGASLLFYPIAADNPSTPNIGNINAAVFGTSSIGTDVFLYVSGGVGQKGTANTHAISVFGGDLHVSGNLTIGGTGGGGTSYWFSTSSNVIYTTGSVELYKSDVVFKVEAGSTTPRTITVEGMNDATGFPQAGRSMQIVAGTAVVSGGGGDLILQGGNAGINTVGGLGGGTIQLFAGVGGSTIQAGTVAGSGGSSFVEGGAGGDANIENTSAGGGGTVVILAGFGGFANVLTGSSGTGGSVNITAGDSQGFGLSENTGSGGAGGSVGLSAGSGASAYRGIGGDGGGIFIAGGAAGPVLTTTGSHGTGGTITLQAGYSAFSGSIYVSKAGNILFGGSNFGASRPSWFSESGSFFIVGDLPNKNLVAKAFFNGNPIIGTAGYPGKDIFFYVSGGLGVKNANTVNSSGSIAVFAGDTLVSGNFYTSRSINIGDNITSTPNPKYIFLASGTVNSIPGGSVQRVAVFGCDMYMSGTIQMVSSSANTSNFIINGNSDGGIGFSGSLINLHANGNTSAGSVSAIQITGLANANAGINEKDILFVVSGNIGGKDTSNGNVSLFRGDAVVSGVFYGLNTASFSSTVIVPTPTTGSAATNKQYVDTPSVRVVTGSTDTLLATDFGKVVAYTLSSSIVIQLNSSLTASFPTGNAGIILLQLEHSASLPIISCSGGTTLNMLSTPYTGSLGCGLLSISSRNGLNWFR